MKNWINPNTFFLFRLINEKKALEIYSRYIFNSIQKRFEPVNRVGVETPYQGCAYYGYLFALQNMMDVLHIPIKQVDWLMYWAVYGGQLETVKCLIDKYNIPLHERAIALTINRSFECVRYLIEEKKAVFGPWSIERAQNEKREYLEQMKKERPDQFTEVHFLQAYYGGAVVFTPA